LLFFFEFIFIFTFEIDCNESGFARLDFASRRDKISWKTLKHFLGRAFD